MSVADHCTMIEEIEHAQKNAIFGRLRLGHLDGKTLFRINILNFLNRFWSVTSSRVKSRESTFVSQYHCGASCGSNGLHPHDGHGFQSQNFTDSWRRV